MPFVKARQHAVRESPSACRLVNAVDSHAAHTQSRRTPSSLRPQVNPYISACALAENELTDDVALALAKSLRRKINPERTDPKLSRRAALYGMLHGAWQKSA